MSDDLLTAIHDELQRFQLLCNDLDLYPKQLRIVQQMPESALLRTDLPYDHPRAPGYEVLMSPADWETCKQEIKSYAAPGPMTTSTTLWGLPVIEE